MTSGQKAPLGLDALDKAIDLLTLSGLADSIGVRYQMIQGWRAKDRRFATPAEHCPEVEKSTGGTVTCEALRPDVDWAYLRGTAQLAEKHPELIPAPAESTDEAAA